MILLENYAIKATTEAFTKALNVGEGITDDINVMLGKVVIMKTNVRYIQGPQCHGVLQ